MTIEEVLMTRQSTVRQNIDNAIYLLLEEDARASSNLLAWAAIDVLQGVAEHQKIETVSHKIESHIRPEKVREWFRYLKEHYNFSKHSDRDAEKEMSFKFESVEMAIFVASVDYQCVYKTVTLPMAFIQSWVMLTKPEILEDGMGIGLDGARRLFGKEPKLERLRELYKIYLENKAEAAKIVDGYVTIEV